MKQVGGTKPLGFFDNQKAICFGSCLRVFLSSCSDMFINSKLKHVKGKVRPPCIADISKYMFEFRTMLFKTNKTKMKGI